MHDHAEILACACDRPHPLPRLLHLVPTEGLRGGVRMAMSAGACGVGQEVG